ncbi:metal ABC transporter substrate-binding protein [Labrenzia sp. PHM005]|uniref:metal ABC transporter substrate-binding protein n=1 Tax=Labrenzia sp. PHM005 TaxID=2590016 RepID=UPI00143D17D1|nr:metal ABC transporter substrate-binding protein [Labrenzia sp. PHM005]
MKQFLILWMFLTAGFCAQAAEGEGTVYVVNYPLQYFAEQIAGDDLDIVFPVPADIDPAYWEPSVDDLVAFQTADLVLLNGAGYANWLTRASLPRSRLIDTSKNFHDRLIPSEGKTVHSHGPEGEHSHGGSFAFTTWLDIALAREQALAVKTAFVRRWPEQKERFEKRHEKLNAELKALEEKLTKAFAPMTGSHVFASHPVYQYLTRAHGLKATSFHWEPDATPSETDWAEFDRKLQKTPVTVMIWEAEPTKETRQRLASKGLKIVILPPLFQTPETGDFLSTLSEASDRL